MAEVSLEGIERLLDSKLEPIKIQLNAVEEMVSDHTEAIGKIVETLDGHTAVLEAIAKNTHDWNTELIAVRARLDRHDQWFKKLSDHLNVRLDG